MRGIGYILQTGIRRITL